MSLKFYFLGESGHSDKVALALELSGLDWSPIFIDFFSYGHPKSHPPKCAQFNG